MRRAPARLATLHLEAILRLLVGPNLPLLGKSAAARTSRLAGDSGGGIALVQVRASRSIKSSGGATEAEVATTCTACLLAHGRWCALPPSSSVMLLGGACAAAVETSSPLQAQCFEAAGSCPASPRAAAAEASRGQLLEDVFGTRRLGETMRDDWDSSPMIDVEHKLIFCEIPKVACTEFKRLFRRLRGAASQEVSQHVEGPADEFDWVHDPKTNGIPRLSALPAPDVRRIMSDPSWTKALFIRDPLERLLSGYLDKCRMPVEERKSIWHCPNPDGFISFADFIEAVLGKTLGLEDIVEMDRHWRPQYLNCDLEDWLGSYQFQGNFSQLYSHTRYLLQGLGLHERYGHGWHTYGEGWTDDPLVGTGSDLFSEDTLGTHAEHALENIQLYYTKALADKAFEFYRRDYEVFGLPRPSWYTTLREIA